jgi:hypothetical protein
MTTLQPACLDVDREIDRIASGDWTPGVEPAAHLANCSRCRDQLALARRIEHALTRADVPEPAAGFTAAIERHLRRDWWKAEQFIDVVFNLAIAGGLGAIGIGIWLLLQLSGLTVVTSDASSMVFSGVRATVASLSPRLFTYTLGLAFVLTTLLVWWWVDDGAAG